jgi:3',5'-cyclic AMP phosphodiesterase CpdA
MSDRVLSRRAALRCMAFGGAGTLFVMAGGVFTPIDLAVAADRKSGVSLGKPLFVQISDTHIGFNKEANPDVGATLRKTIELVNGMPAQPGLILHTGDITHLSKPAEFDQAQSLLSGLRATEIHTVPGEHDVSDATVSEYFNRFGAPSRNRGYYSFDHSGVHFIGLINVLQFKPGGLGSLGADQLAWVESDLRGRSDSTPIVIFAHMPLWNIYEQWGWGTSDADQLFAKLRRFGSVTVLNGHIHQIVQKVEGNITFHTARSTAYPQPVAGTAAGPGPLKVPSDALPRMLGVTSVTEVRHPRSLVLADSTLGDDSSHAGIAAGAGAGAQAAAAPLAAPAAPNTVTIANFMFAPTSLRVNAGTTVRWLNMDEEPHTVVSATGLFRSNALDTKDTFTFRFDKPGTYQ